MKKIAILTINDYGNYGNRLQNYAVQEIIKSLGFKVVTINNQKNMVGLEVLNYKIKKIIKKFFINSNIKRFNNFMEFNKNIKFSKIFIDENHIPKKLNNKYDYFFTGSDQVWNPTFKRMSDIDFLTFASKEKRNSFSASFGISTIPKEMREYYKERLNELNHISVREDAGKKIIEELTGRKDVEVLVDPTMLLTSEEWDKVSKKPKMLKTEKYILNYFLGDLSQERRKEIEKIAKENNCEVINILDKNSPFYVCGPSEFLYLEKHAFLICTDSFHSSVFAILYNRPFVIFDREQEGMNNMGSRLDTLLNKFKLKNRRYNGKYISKENLKHDYTEVYKILEAERKKSDNFLRKALNIKDSE